MTKLFISHGSKDDNCVRQLQQALADQNQDVWIDSRHLRGDDPPWSAIQEAIEAASAYAVVVSPDSLQSKWVGKELRHALEVRKKRNRPGFIRRFLFRQKPDGKDRYPVIPLSLDGARPGH